MSKYMAAAGIISGALALSACASQPDQISAAYVSPIQFQNYSCEQVQMEMARVSRKANELHGALKKKADNDAAQTAASLVFWPTLFFLEGGDGPQATEYARLKGERDTLEATAIQKSCSLVVEPSTPADSPISPTDKTTTVKGTS